MRNGSEPVAGRNIPKDPVCKFSPRRDRFGPWLCETRVRHQAQPLAHPCPCCGGRMFVIETFEAGSQPRHPPTAPLVANRIDTIKRCATAPKNRAPSPTSLYPAYARPKGP
jgi:hypothetical protein